MQRSTGRLPIPLVFRGWVFRSQPANVRSANRNNNAPADRNTNNVFRLASTAQQYIQCEVAGA